MLSKPIFYLLSALYLFTWKEACGIDFPAFQTVPHVDLNRYMGTWYEISRLEDPWDRACFHNPISIYKLKSDGSIQIVSHCETDNFFNKIQRAEGTAEVVDKKTNAKWKVTFPPTEHEKGLPNGDYWIIHLAKDYSYAAVSEPTQKHLWILSKTPDMPQDIYQSILDQVVLMMPDLNVLNVLPTKQDPLDQRKEIKN